MADNQARHFAALHGQGRKVLVLAIAAKTALIVAAFLLLRQVNLHLTLGVPALLLHSAFAALLGWMLIRSIARHRLRASTVKMQLQEGSKPSAVGILLHSAWTYDAFAWLFTFGRERTFRESILRFARLKPGETVLDVGCGTGTTALLAKRQVGPGGRVEGIDASSEMIARADKKAGRAGVEVHFRTAAAQALPYAAEAFDVVLSTLMFHHLPRAGRPAFVAEAHRVLKPGGRMLLVDFAKDDQTKTRASLHRHGHVDMQAAADAFTQSSFKIVERGDVGTKGLSYLVAMRGPFTTQG